MNVTPAPTEHYAAAFRRILVPIDFGAASTPALDVAAELAERFDATLLILHVIDVPTVHYYSYADAVARSMGDVVAKAEGLVARVLADTKTKHAKTDARVVTGDAWTNIVDQARERAVDLVVMGTHARVGAKRLFRASVAENVVRHAPVPVLIVRAA